MAVAKSKDFTSANSTYPETFDCVCGRKAQLKNKDVTTFFKGTEIIIKNVPVYECSSEHIKTARITRVKIKNLLKEAHNTNSLEIDYK